MFAQGVRDFWHALRDIVTGLMMPTTST